MPKRIRLRELTFEEETKIRKLAESHEEPEKLIQRARVIVAMLDNPSIPASRAGEMAGFTGAPGGIRWVKRFNENGIEGLRDGTRPGRPPTHPREARDALVNLALQKPQNLGYPYETWTLEKLQNAFEEHHGVHLSDSTIWTWVEDAGYCWRSQDHWQRQAEEKAAYISD